jgi:pyridoxamine 5'-phosphate oxidase
MIVFKDLPDVEPYQQFQKDYFDAEEANQPLIHAIAISSFNKTLNEVESRFVNLKYIEGEEWIFFSNYNSPKARSFQSHDQISAMFYWSTTNIQIRMKANIKETNKERSDEHFQSRQKEKNALAIASNQSQPISSFETVKSKFTDTLENADLRKRPDYWGGFSFTPYYFEFWRGSDFRLNHRNAFSKVEDGWESSILEP